MRLLHLAFAACTLPLLMGASIYRWVDQDGVVNYSQTRPEGVRAERVDEESGSRAQEVVDASPGERAAPTLEPTAPAGSTAQSGQDESGLNESQKQMLRDLRAAEQARQDEVARIKESNCEQARAVLERLTARGRIRVRGEDGAQRVMPEEERQQRIEEAQRGIAANCASTASR